jgi:peptide/nickel transport system substrate-binding protein
MKHRSIRRGGSRRGAMLAGAALVLGLAAGAAAPAGASVPEDVVTGGDLEFLVYVSMTSTDPKLNPNVSSTTSPGQVAYIYDTLLRVASDGTITPRLATGIEPSDDLTQWTLTLRDGLTFTDGTPLDAEAVKFNWERHQNPEEASQCILQASQIAGLEAASPTELGITLARPNSQFPFLLQGCLGLIASPAALQEFGAEYGTAADKTVGAGPFKLQSFTASESYTLERNPDFWDAPRPYLDTVHVVGVPTDQTTEAQAFLTQEADMAFFPNTGATTVLTDAGFEPLAGDYIGGEGWIFNATKAPFDDARVRRALYLAIDLDAINQAAFGGTAPVNDGFFPADSPFADPSLNYPEHDPEEAQRLIDEYLAEQGLESIDVNMIGLSGSMDPVAVAAGQALDQIEGVNFAYEPQPPLGMRDRVFGKSFDVAAWLVSGDAMYPTLYDSLYSQSPTNFSGFGDPEIDAAFDAALATNDPEVIKENFQTVARRFIEEMPYLVLWSSHVTTFTQDYVHGAEVSGYNFVDVSTVWVDQ